MSKEVLQTYNDGSVKIYNVEDIAESGKAPKMKFELKGSFRYQERTVGIKRYEAALQRQVEIEMVLRMPRIQGINPQDIAVPNDGHQYKIDRVVMPPDEPESMDISLERIDPIYEIY